MMVKPFPSMVEKVPAGQFGSARVVHVEVSRHASDMTMLASMRPGGRDYYVPPGRYAQLWVNQTLWMSDTPMEHRTNMSVLWEARGDVLIAGLGLGMLLWPLLGPRKGRSEFGPRRPPVRSVTVLESSADVIGLISPHTPKDARLTILHADAYEYKPARGAFDIIYFDIWADQTTDDLANMTRLHRRYRSGLRSGGWMESWRRGALRWRRDNEDRETLAAMSAMRVRARRSAADA